MQATLGSALRLEPRALSQAKTSEDSALLLVPALRAWDTLQSCRMGVRTRAYEACAPLFVVAYAQTCKSAVDPESFKASTVL